MSVWCLNVDHWYLLFGVMLDLVCFETIHFSVDTEGENQFFLLKRKFLSVLKMLHSNSIHQRSTVRYIKLFLKTKVFQKIPKAAVGNILYKPIIDRAPLLLKQVSVLFHKNIKKKSSIHDKGKSL